MRKIAGIVTVFLLTFLISFFTVENSIESKAATYKGFQYKTDGNTVSIKKYVGKKANVTIPKKIKGKKVTEICKYAFAYNYRIKKLVIPEGVEKIGYFALFDMPNLVDISFPQTLKSMTKNTGFHVYSEEKNFPKKTIRVVKGSAAFRFVTKKCVGQKIKTSKQKKVVIWYDDNGATWDKTLTAKLVTKGKKCGELPEPVREGYQFLGWYTKKKGGKKITAKTKIVKNQTLYAHWCV